MKLRYNILNILLLVQAFHINAQVKILPDTINIEEVIIKGKENDLGEAVFQDLCVDSAIFKDYSLLSVADLLNTVSQLFIKSYGAGGIATPSFRGTGASHTQVLWNGLNINNPMLGQADFSIIPAGISDKIKISSGSASLISGDGSIGGTVNLTNEPEWERETNLSVNSGLGGYGRKTMLLKAITGNKKFQSVTRAFYSSAENNFKYLNRYSGLEPTLEKRNNGQISQKGFLEEFYLKGVNSVLSARMWYQHAFRNIPSPVISQQINNAEYQVDESFRSMIDYDFRKSNLDLFMQAAFMSTSMDYTNQLTNTESDNHTRSLIIKGGFENHLNEHDGFKVILNNELINARSNNYGQDISRNTFSLSVNSYFMTMDRLRTSLLIKETIDKNRFLLPDFSVGMQLFLTSDKNQYIKGNISRNSKIPSLNDLYWSPGGSIDLKNEYSFSFESGYGIELKVGSKIKFRSDLNFYRNYIRDMILWQPGENSFWEAENIRRANTSGIELTTSVDYSFNNIDLDILTGYYYTKAAGSNNATEKIISDQLVYVPEHMFNGSLRIAFKKLYSLWTSDLTGRRYTLTDNSAFLPGYFIHNATLGIKISPWNSIIDLNIRIENLLNKEYETVAFYPQPGRSCFISVIIIFGVI